MLIRRCLVEDMPKLLEIWLQATLHAHDYLPAAAWWPRQERLRQRLQATDDIWVVEAQAEVDDEPAGKGSHSRAGELGVVGFMAIKDDELLALYLLPEFQRQGMGRTLLELGKQYHQTLFLNVCLPNEEAVTFYRRHGFRIVREQQDPRSACDEYMMEYRKSPLSTLDNFPQ